MEIWIDIRGYEKMYQISNFGNVKSLDRISFNKEGYFKNLKGNVLRQRLDSNGYYSVSLCKEGKVSVFRVHQLIAISFYNHVLSRKMNVDHIDNVKTNNILSNIQVISARKNTSKDRLNKTGCTGVYKCKKNNYYFAQIRIRGKRIHLGYSKEKQNLSLLYEKAINNLHVFDGDTNKFRKFLK